MTTGSVVSKDGTPHRLPTGRPGPGGGAAARQQRVGPQPHQLALALADALTVYLPDRRGRGLSGPHRPDHSIRTEVEDLQAVLTGSGAQKVFGVSVSALIALEASRTQPAIRQIAAYEPALLMDTTRYTDWVRRFDQEMAQGKVAAALITSMYGLDLAPPAFRLMGRRLAEALTNRAMESEDKKAAEDTVTERQLAPTLRYEGLLLAETAGTIGAFAEVPAEVLLLAGDMKRPAFIKPAFDAFARTLPHNRRIRFPAWTTVARPTSAQPTATASRRSSPRNPVFLHPAMSFDPRPAPAVQRPARNA